MYVGDLKDAKKKPIFYVIPADSLLIWKASVECSQNEELYLGQSLVVAYQILSDISWLLKFFRCTVDSLGSRRHIEVRNRFVKFAMLEMMKLTAQNEGRFTPEFFFWRQ